MTFAINPATDEIWRFWIGGRDANNHRWITSETWHVANHLPLSAIQSLGTFRHALMKSPFGTATGAPRYLTNMAGTARIYGGPLFHNQFSSWNSTTGPILNINAPEAACRLQRVGAAGDSAKAGRMCYPILSDSLYTDLPHRRHVDVTYLDNLLNAGARTWLNDGFITLVRIRNVVWHRASLTCTRVDDYQILPNPVRLWQRWRSYPGAGHVSLEDNKWYPEMSALRP